MVESFATPQPQGWTPKDPTQPQDALDPFSACLSKISQDMNMYRE